MALPAILLSLLWVALMLYWLFSALGAKRNARRTYGTWLIRLLIFVIVFLIYSSPGARPYFVGAENSMPIALQWFGVILTACGVAFAVWARVNLGRNWGMPMSLKQDAELVTSGPYAYVRHPIYTGFMLAALGSCFVSIWWVVPLVLMSIYFIYSATQEEKIMTDEFPALYPDYMKRTKMLIPFVL